MEPFKNIFNKESITKIANEIQKYSEDFDKDLFIKTSLKGIKCLEMKQRVEQISNAINSSFNKDYKYVVKVLLKTLGSEQDHIDNKWDGQDSTGITGFIVWPYSEYISTYGLNHFDISMKAIKEITKVFTGEFAIRPFLEMDYDRSRKYLDKWVKDKNHHVRRLVSEGTRPNLPWGKKVQSITNEPKVNLDLLIELSTDESEYVSRSVANHINDISHLDKALTLKTLKKLSKNKDVPKKLVRHALRTLLKKGEPDALLLMGYSPKAEFNLTKAKLDKKEIELGDSLNLSFDFKSLETKESKFLLEYNVHFLKSNGSYSVKHFRLADKKIKEEQTIQISKKLPFKNVTTRKHYEGKHLIDIQVNGVVVKTLKFKLNIPKDL